MADVLETALMQIQFVVPTCVVDRDAMGIEDDGAARHPRRRFIVEVVQAFRGSEDVAQIGADTPYRNAMVLRGRSRLLHEKEAWRWLFTHCID